MSERFNRNDAKFARAIQRQEGQSWLRRQKENLDRRSQTIAEQMRGVFSGYMMTPAAVLAGEVVSARYQYGEAFYGAAYQTAELAYRGGSGDPWKMFTGALASSEGKKREGGRISIEGKNLFLIICFLILAAMILGACTPPPAGAQALETGTPTADAPTTIAPTESAHEIPTIGVPATPTGESTEIVDPTDEPTPTLEPTDEPTAEPTQEQQAPTNWERPPVDNLGDYNYDCTVTGTSFDIEEIAPGIEATGFLICGGQRVPAGIYDRNTNTLYYWGLNPIKNPTITDHLGERGVERFVTFFGFGETYLDCNKLTGANLSLSIGLPNARNGAVFDVQNIGQFADEYYGSQAAIDAWANTGVFPDGQDILYPVSLGVVK